MSKRIPAYRLHKSSGQAIVHLNGKRHYLGKHGTEESKRSYDALVSEYLRHKRKKTGKPSVADAPQMTLAQLVVAYMRYAKGYYRKNGKETSEVAAIRSVMNPLVAEYGRCLVSEFGPLELKDFRQQLIVRGIVRKSINTGIGRIKRMFKWGVENEIVFAETLAGLQAVAGLRFGRSEARESRKVDPAPIDDVNAVKGYVTRPVWGLIQIQLATGMRPGEARIMRACDIDQSSEVWVYRPESHKTEHHGRDRVVFIGPDGQAVLKPFLLAGKPTGGYLFSPRDGREEFLADRKANRKTPMTPSQLARQRKPVPKRKPRAFYGADSYAHSVRSGCEAAGVPIWKPNQLRHNVATEMRKKYPLEVVRTVLGHASGFTTEVYAELDLQAARRVMAEIG